MYTSTSSGDLSGGAAAGLMAFMGVMWLIWLAVIVLVIAGLWKVFVKAGQPGWAAIVPIYNYYILLQIVGRPAWWIAAIFLPIIPVLGGLAMLVVQIIVMNDLSKSFGKDVGFTVGLVLLSPVFVPILGFGDSRYLGPMATGFGNPETPGGGMGGGMGGGYQPPAGGYAPPPAPPVGGGYQPPAPPAAPPAAPMAPPAPPAAPMTPPAPPAASPAAPMAPPAQPAPPAPPAPPEPPA
jgi:hypothetical protein